MYTNFSYLLSYFINYFFLIILYKRSFYFSSWCIYLYSHISIIFLSFDFILYIFCCNTFMRSFYFTIHGVSIYIHICIIFLSLYFIVYFFLYSYMVCLCYIIIYVIPYSTDHASRQTAYLVLYACVQLLLHRP